MFKQSKVYIIKLSFPNKYITPDNIVIIINVIPKKEVKQSIVA